MDEQKMLQASQLEQNIKNADENLQFVDSQISELGEFKQGLDTLKETAQTDMFSSIGKGVYVKTTLQEKSLFVDVGMGIILRKTPIETKEIIESQIRNLNVARIQILGEFDSYKNELFSLIRKAQQTN